MQNNEGLQNQNENDKKGIILNNQVNALLDVQNGMSQQTFGNSFGSLCDLLIYIEKRKPQILPNVIQINILSILLQNHRSYMRELIKGFILLFGNCKQNGLLSNHIVTERLVSKCIIQYVQFMKKDLNYDEQEHLNEIAAFLKVVHRHITAENYQYFYFNDRFILLEVCCKFFNCPEEITRTSILNILMTLLQLPFAEKFLYPNGDQKLLSCIQNWSINLCKQFRNQLKDFDQHLLVMTQSQRKYMIVNVNDKVVLWQDLSKISSKIFKNAFYNEIVLPLLIGSLNTQGVPLFTLKFALFILNKLMKVLSNLNLLNQIGKLLFTNQTIQYKDQILDTSILPPFNLKNILDAPIEELPLIDQIQTFSGINLFFSNILKSKDGTFLEMGSSLMINLLSFIKKNGDSIQFYIDELGFGLNGFTVNAVSLILINQFCTTHKLQTIKAICELLLYIQPAKYLMNDVKNVFIHNYQTIILEALHTVQKNKEITDQLIGAFEFDVKLTTLYTFKPQIKADEVLLFASNVLQNEDAPFYDQIPQTPQAFIRYNVVKFLILQKFSQIVLDEYPVSNCIENYIQRIKYLEGKYIMPGQYVKLPLVCNSYQLNLVDGKLQIPSLLLQDDNNLIIGVIEGMNIKVIMNIKFKNLEALLESKKKNMIEVRVKAFDFEKQMLKRKSEIYMKHLPPGLAYFTVKKSKSKQKQYNLIIDILKKSNLSVPEISLI